MKIVYCLQNPGFCGGLPIVTIVKANALSKIAGNEVWITHTEECHATARPLSPDVHLVDLGIRYSDNHETFPRSLFLRMSKKRANKRMLSKALNEISPDIVVSVDEGEKWFIPSIRGRWKCIREIHLARGYRRMVPHLRLIDSLVDWAGEWIDYEWACPRYDRVVLLTDEDKEKNWRGAKNVEVIPNPLTFIPGSTAPLKNQRVIAVGRLDLQKNYSSLIRAFKRISSTHPGWHLDIFGEGEQRLLLQSLIDESGLSDKVFLRGVKKDIQSEMMDASMLVMSSLFEGFPLVMTEAAGCGLPVVCYDFPCGPKDFIEDGKNGFIVKMGDEESLADRINRLIEDEDLRLRMGAAAAKSAGKYHPDVISRKWMDLFERMMCN